MDPLRVGVIGYGYWGPNLVRNFFEVSGSEVQMVCDLKPEILAKVQNRYPNIATTSRCDDLFEAPQLDAVVVATPVSSHFDLALSALQSGKHVLVEKPMAASSTEAERLIAEAEKRERVLMVDHTFVYTGAVRRIKEYVDNGELGDLYYYDSTRVNLGLFQHDVSVIWDLGGSRSFHHGVYYFGAACRSFGYRYQPSARSTGKHRIPDGFLRKHSNCAHTR